MLSNKPSSLCNQINYMGYCKVSQNGNKGLHRKSSAEVRIVFM